MSAVFVVVMVVVAGHDDSSVCPHTRVTAVWKICSRAAHQRLWNGAEERKTWSMEKDQNPLMVGV
jgi:hypothetical protein